ncbi:AmiS/UreI family transporter [Fictibacillus aquaticus]|uniref:Acetamide transporter n=1 Tax=Fictibacillus aquaticus TaxID=2021314 RepID=A0A235F7H8_9BACL|nr:AmiS/UreI family transporter [Fictibacillus aquaticus]OYD57270.1 hypothetical protein CGZ90_11315 [Fictibacillus aquaticus]
MGAIGLFLSGAALFINSMMLSGKADARSAAIFNLFVGAFQIAAPFYLVITSDGSSWATFNNGAIFLFGLTYLYLGVTILKDLDTTGLGWYSLWVAIVALVYAAVYFVQQNDIVNTLIWIMWAFLWFLFYLLSAVKKPIEAYIGKIAFVQSWTTLTIPAMLMMLGVWSTPNVQQIWLFVSLASIAYFVIVTVRYAITAKKEYNTQTA